MLKISLLVFLLYVCKVIIHKYIEYFELNATESNRKQQKETKSNSMGAITYIALEQQQLDALLIQTAKTAIEIFKIEKSKENMLTTGQAAAKLNVTIPTVVKYIDKGKIKAMQFEKVFRISEYAVNQFKKNHLK